MAHRGFKYINHICQQKKKFNLINTPCWFTNKNAKKEIVFKTNVYFKTIFEYILSKLREF